MTYFGQFYGYQRVKMSWADFHIRLLVNQQWGVKSYYWLWVVVCGWRFLQSCSMCFLLFYFVEYTYFSLWLVFVGSSSPACWTVVFDIVTFDTRWWCFSECFRCFSWFRTWFGWIVIFRLSFFYWILLYKTEIYFIFFYFIFLYCISLNLLMQYIYFFIVGIWWIIVLD